MPANLKVSLQDVIDAKERISPHVQRTKMGYSPSCSDLLGCSVYLKYENEQFTGSFKIRGATNKLLCLTAEEKKRGIVTASAGNHAQGVALAAAKLGIQSTIVMPVHSPMIKVTATRNYGANVILAGEMYDDAHKEARKIENEKKLVFVHPFEDEKVIAGQGTIGLEIFEDQADLDSLIIPIGGGGLIAGIATAFKAKNPNAKVYGVVPKNTPGMSYLSHQKSLENMRLSRSIADGTAVKSPSLNMFNSFVEPLVDQIVEVAEEEIAHSMVFFLERVKTVVEGAGAMALAGALQKKFNLGKKTGLILCGGNVDLNLLSVVINKGLSSSGRLAQLTVVVPDQPGSLQKVTEAIAAQGANILNVVHDRLRPYLQIRETSIELLLETFNDEHIDKIKKSLVAVGGVLRDH